MLLYVYFCAALVEFTEADEALADQALLGDVFLFMKEGILGCESFSQEEFYIRRVHSLITDFLALMPMKVRDAAGAFNLRLTCKTIIWFLTYQIQHSVIITFHLFIYFCILI